SIPNEGGDYTDAARPVQPKKCLDFAALASEGCRGRRTACKARFTCHLALILGSGWASRLASFWHFLLHFACIFATGLRRLRSADRLAYTSAPILPCCYTLQFFDRRHRREIRAARAPRPVVCAAVLRGPFVPSSDVRT